MKGIFGIILMVGGGWGAWWIFTEAAREDYSDLAGLVAAIVCLVGIILIISQVKNWWMAE